MLCGIDNIPPYISIYSPHLDRMWENMGIFARTMSAPQNNVMDMDNVMKLSTL